MKNTSYPELSVWVCVLVLAAVALACNYPTRGAEPLAPATRSEDGTVSGSFRYPAEAGGQQVAFSVTAGGFAIFSLAGAPESETLTVDLRDERTASLAWNGATLDGVGALTAEEQAALERLLDSELAYAIERIPLEAGCQGEQVLDPRQPAALLVPLQMRFKYAVTDRAAEAQRLLAISACGATGEPENQAEQAALITFSPSLPVPVVFGFFPFDEQGAVEAPAASGNGAHVACPAPALLEPAVSAGSAVAPIFLSEPPGTIFDARINEKGPCNAMCRGACGADCPLSNCDLKTELGCETDAAGLNTGMEIQYLVYDCGMHPGCIDHDDCYDNCNEKYGCGTWFAAVCRHGWAGDPVTLSSHPDWWCDEKAVAAHGAIDPPLWSRGYGPQPLRETFIYTDESYEKRLNLERCPTGDPSAEQPEATEPPAELGTQEVGVADICALLPVDESLVVNRTQDACVAEFDSYVGCGECGSSISITRLDSAEMAQQAVLSGNCGNPNFSARGESPLGDAGFTCTDTSGEAYREGVAQLYFYINFSYGPYAAQIFTGYPGLENLILDLGEGIIERIDRLDPTAKEQ